LLRAAAERFRTTKLGLPTAPQSRCFSLNVAGDRRAQAATLPFEVHPKRASASGKSNLVELFTLLYLGGERPFN